MLKIAFFTTTRAEFGIMSSVIQKINKNDFFEGLLFVGGTHLKNEYGNTIDEIKSLGLEVTDTFDYLEEGDSSYSLSTSSGKCSIEVARIFKEYDFDIISVLGDRYELIPLCLTALLFNKPIIHWGGGEFTEGVIDNQIRQMVTKAANVHFVAAKKYEQNILNLGEKKEHVCVTGSPVIETFKEIEPINKEDLFENLGLNINDKTILLTYHPVTIEFGVSPLDQIKNLFEALSKYEYQIVITSPNLESDRQIIVDYLSGIVESSQRIHYFESLGIRRYHSLIPHCCFLIGNSSSGIFEAPFFKVPTINIGDRQKGRYMHESVINTDYQVDSIEAGIEKTFDADFKASVENLKYQFGDGHASEKAIAYLKALTVDENLIRKV